MGCGREICSNGVARRLCIIGVTEEMGFISSFLQIDLLIYDVEVG